jgi:tetratricopeptide (TPR) repeat protein
VLFEAAHPILLRRLSAMEYQTEIAREYMLRAEENRKKGDYLASLRAMEGYLAIDPRSKEAAALRLSLEPQAAKQKAAMTARPPEEDVVPAGASAEGLVAKARSSFAQGDWYSAHYFAQQASRLDPSRSDALRLAVQAWDRITSAERASADAAQMELFQKKTAAYALLAKRNDPVAAYYAFLALSVRYPKDQDIATYLARAGEEARKVSFFLDEVRGIETLPGTRRILFLERKERGSIEAVFIGKMIETAQGTAYLFDTEAIRYAPSGAVAWHFTAPYGKLHGGVLLMQCLDGSNPDLRSLPLYHQGARPAAERNLLALRPTVEELRALSMDRGALSAMGLPELWRLRTDLGSLGISRESLNMEMAKKAVMPFAYLILALFSLSLGWALRDRTVGRPSAFSIILVPLVPVVVSLASLLYIHAHRILLGFTFLAFGLTVAAIVFAALQLALLVIALVLIAGQAAH